MYTSTYIHICICVCVCVLGRWACSEGPSNLAPRQPNLASQALWTAYSDQLGSNLPPKMALNPTRGQQELNLSQHEANLKPGEPT